MKIFLDCEFIESPSRLQLVSLGAVTDNGDEFYAISSEFDPSAAKQWVKDNVLAKLPSRSAEPEMYGTRAEIAKDFREWVQEVQANQAARGSVVVVGKPPAPPSFWGYFCDYDYVVLSRELFGGMLGWPEGWPQYFNDLRQYMTYLGVTRDMLPPDPPNQHNAFADAIWIREAYKIVSTLEGPWIQAEARRIADAPEWSKARAE